MTEKRAVLVVEDEHAISNFICRALTVLWEKPTGIGRAEVVLVDQDLGL